MSKIDYITDTSEVEERSLGGFFVGWPTLPSPTRHLALLRSSYRVVLARDADTRQVVGFITAISDGEVAAYIPLLEVLPPYQRKGIGTELVRRLLTELDGLYMVDLCCDSELVPFYERFGMTPVAGMVLRNYRTLENNASTD